MFEISIPPDAEVTFNPDDAHVYAASCTYGLGQGVINVTRITPSTNKDEGDAILLEGDKKLLEAVGLESLTPETNV